MKLRDCCVDTRRVGEELPRDFNGMRHNQNTSMMKKGQHDNTTDGIHNPYFEPGIKNACEVRRRFARSFLARSSAMLRCMPSCSLREANGYLYVSCYGAYEVISKMTDFKHATQLCLLLLVVLLRLLVLFCACMRQPVH